MNLTDSFLCVWPGLPKLWLRGALGSLVLAVLFAIALNLALINTFLWPHWMVIASPGLVWPILFVVWGYCAFTGFRNLPDLLLIPDDIQPSAGKPDFLSDAQMEYLRGHYEEAELLLRRQLNRYPDDIPAGLMLGTLYRHQGRLVLAKRQLSQLSKWDLSIRWRFEIDKELDTIEELLAQSNENPAVEEVTEAA